MQISLLPSPPLPTLCLCMRKTKIKVYASASVFDNKNKNSFCWYGTMSVWYDGKYSSHSHSRAANENLPQFVGLCKKVHCTLINQNSGPTTTTKRITILRFFITNIKHTHTHTHIFMASSDASLQTNELYGWCFSYVLLCDAINYSNETRPPEWVHFGWLKNTQLQQLRRSRRADVTRRQMQLQKEKDAQQAQ